MPYIRRIAMQSFKRILKLFRGFFLPRMIFFLFNQLHPGGLFHRVLSIGMVASSNCPEVHGIIKVYSKETSLSVQFAHADHSAYLS